jgi:hypothetical protein
MQTAQPALFVETFAEGDAQLAAQLIAHVSQRGGGVTPSGQSILASSCGKSRGSSVSGAVQQT